MWLAFCRFLGWLLLFWFKMLHLKKLSVGSESIEGLEDWHQQVLKTRGKLVHVTRSFPRRGDEILKTQGSIFWVIKGKMLVRQAITDFVEIEREDGGRSCGIVLKQGLIPLIGVRHRPFQGWRYLNGDDAPADLPQGMDAKDVMSAEMAEELRALGLI